MKTNFTQAKSWIKSATNDINRVLKGLKRKDFADVAFRSQFAIEKLNKAILSFMGLKIEKTHTPTEILDMALNDENMLKIDEKGQTILRKIIFYSKFFEKQGTQTRYGSIDNNKLTIAEDIYDNFNKIKDFIINLKNSIDYDLLFLKEILMINEKEFEGLQELKSLLRKLNKWI